MANTQASDETLMLAYCDGDAAAFEVLYQRYRGALYRYFLRQCRHPATAEELFQDVWMRLVRARKAYEPRARFSTYIFHMAHNHFIDHYRRQSGRAPLSYGAEFDPADIPASDCDGPERSASTREQMSRLMQSIDIFRLLPTENKALSTATEAEPTTEQWLTQIKDLIKKGRQDEANKLIERFKTRYPDYPIDKELELNK